MMSDERLELLVEAEIVAADRLKGLQAEADELMANFASSIITTKQNR